MHRFFLPPAECAGGHLALRGREAHHARHVLRLRPGQTVTILDGDGAEILCEVGPAAGEELALRVLERRAIPAPACPITLLQAVPKGKLFEAIIQKATELGAARIVPLISARTVVQVDEEKAEHKAAKWQTIVIEAVKQCGSPWLPKVEVPVTPGQFLARAESFELAMVGSLRSDRRHPHECFEQFRRHHGRNPKSAAVWIGPEGDFTPEELAAIQDAGVWPITLGRLVLRTDTAAIYCLSILNYEVDAPA